MTDKTFLKSYNPDDFPHPSVAVDVVLISVVQEQLKALLVQRDAPPQRGKWSLPGGFVGIDEGLEAAAARILDTKAGLKDVYLEQLYTFGAPNRDPRTRVITVSYYALVNAEKLGGLPLSLLDIPWQGEAGGTATTKTVSAKTATVKTAPAKTVSVKDDAGAALDLAFDHAKIISTAVTRIRGKLNYSPIGFQLLPKHFTLRELQRVHEVVLGQAQNKDSFRRRMLATGVLRATGTYEQDTPYRPAELYEFVAGSAV